MPSSQDLLKLRLPDRLREAARRQTAVDSMRLEKFSLRFYQKSDRQSIARIYRDSIEHLGNRHYSAEQVGAWSGFADDRGAFEAWLNGARTLVAVDDTGSVIGFGGIEPTGRISSLFVAPAAMRKGVGSALLCRLLDEARSNGLHDVSTHASEFSRAVFEKNGFVVTQVEHTRFRGVEFMRYLMLARI